MTLALSCADWVVTSPKRRLAHSSTAMMRMGVERLIFQLSIAWCWRNLQCRVRVMRSKCYPISTCSICIVTVWSQSSISFTYCETWANHWHAMMSIVYYKSYILMVIIRSTSRISLVTCFEHPRRIPSKFVEKLRCFTVHPSISYNLWFSLFNRCSLMLPSPNRLPIVILIAIDMCILTNVYDPESVYHHQKRNNQHQNNSNGLFIA